MRVAHTTGHRVTPGYQSSWTYQYPLGTSQSGLPCCLPLVCDEGAYLCMCAVLHVCMYVLACCMAAWPRRMPVRISCSSGHHTWDDADTAILMAVLIHAMVSQCSTKTLCWYCLFSASHRLCHVCRLHTYFYQSSTSLPMMTDRPMHRGPRFVVD